MKQPNILKMLFLCLVLVFTISGCGGGGSSTSSTEDSNEDIVGNANTTVADYAGIYKGTIDYNLTEYHKYGVPIQAEVGIDGSLTNINIDGNSTDTSAAKMVSESGTENNGLISGTTSFYVSGISSVVNAAYTGQINVETGAVTITYRISGGLSGTIIVTGTKVPPQISTSGSATHIDALYSVNEFGPVTLDASHTIPTSASFQWQIISKPDGSAATINNSTSSKAVLLPDIGGTYVVQVAASTGRNATSTTTLTISADKLPIIDITIEPEVDLGQPSLLDGSRCYAQNGELVSLEWYLLATYTSGYESVDYRESTISIDTIASFTPTSLREYKIGYTVTDESGHSNSGKTTVTARPPYINNGNGRKRR